MFKYPFNMTTHYFVFGAMLAGAMTLWCAEGPQVFAIRDARIVPVSQPRLEKGTVVVRDGLIEAVGANLQPPPDAWVINGEGLTVYPGLIDALSTWGIPATTSSTTPAITPRTRVNGPEDRPSNTSYRKAADEIVAFDRNIEAARDAGFTTAVTYPTANIFAGQGVIFNLAGERAGQMVVDPSAGMYISIPGARTSGGVLGNPAASRSFPGSLMGVIAYVRQIYLDADHYTVARQLYTAHPQASRRPAYDRTLEAVLASPRILLPATRAVEVDRMVRFGQELKRNFVIYGGAEAWRSADLLKQSGTPVLLSLKWPDRPPTADPDEPDSLRVLEMRDKAPSTAGVLAKSGVKFAFFSDGIANPRDVTKAVRKAIDSGLTPEDAIRAMTLNAAEIYNVADRMGSIEKGKIANLVVTNGELFHDQTRIRYVFVDGVKYEPLERTR